MCTFGVLGLPCGSPWRSEIPREDLQPQFLLCFVSLSGSFRGILVVFSKAEDTRETKRATRRKKTRNFGLSDTRKLQTRTFERPGASNNHQKFREKTPRERRKNDISGGRQHESAKFRAPPPPLFGPQPFRAPTPSGHPFGPSLFRALTKIKKNGQMRFGEIRSTKIGPIRPNIDGQLRPVNFGQMWYWLNVGLAKCRMAKTGLAKCGRDRGRRAIRDDVRSLVSSSRK